MMIRRWFALAFVDQFASGVLQDLATSLSAVKTPSDKSKNPLKQKRRQEAALKALYREAVDFGRRENLNFFQKARLSKKLQDGLIRCGHSAEFAKNFVVELIADMR